MLYNVALLGLAGSGKTSIASEMAATAEYRRVSFAKPIKLQIGRMLVAAGVGTDPYQAVEDNKAAVRPLLQACGQVMRAVAGPDHWVNLAMRMVDNYSSIGAPVVIDDLRYPNEATELRRRGFVIIRVVRPGAGLVGDAGQHESEAGQSDIQADHTIYNVGTIAEAAVWVRAAAQLHQASRYAFE